MESTERPVNDDLIRGGGAAVLLKALHGRADSLMGRLHELTKRRDRRQIGFGESLVLEQALVAEIGQIQDRLRLLGCHPYDGCLECRPGGGGQAPSPIERKAHAL